MNNNNYQIPVKAIKNILLREHESFMMSLDKRLGYSHDYDRYILNVMNNKIRKIIESANTYDDLENFISDSRRMSLQEWIDSL